MKNFFKRIVHIFFVGSNEVFFLTKSFVLVIVHWIGSKDHAYFLCHQVVQRKPSGQKEQR